MIDFEKYMIAEEGLLISTKKSRARVLSNISNIEKGMQLNFDMCEKAIKYLKEFANFIFSFRFSGDIDTDVKGCQKKVDEFQKKMHDIDYDRGSEKELMSISMSYLKRSMNRKFNRADYRHQEIGDAEAALQKKCSEGGEYYTKAVNLAKAFNDLETLVNKRYEAASNDNEVLKDLIRVYLYEHNWAKGQSFLLTNDIVKVVKK